MEFKRRSIQTWKIFNFSISPINSNGMLKSKNFTYLNHTYNLTVFYECCTNKNLCVKISRSGSEPFPDIVCLMSLQDKNEENSYLEMRNMSWKESQKVIRMISVDKFLELKSELLPDDCLTIVSEFMPDWDDLEVKEGPEICRIFPVYHGLSRDLGHLFTTGRNSDAVIIVEGKEMPVHTQILSARSEVFAAMFQHDMEEKRNRIVNIPDFSAVTIACLLRFIYTGESSVVEDLTSKLLLELCNAANEYAVIDLKFICVKIMLFLIERARKNQSDPNQSNPSPSDSNQSNPSPSKAIQTSPNPSDPNPSDPNQSNPNPSKAIQTSPNPSDLTQTHLTQTNLTQTHLKQTNPNQSNPNPSKANQTNPNPNSID